MDKDCKITLHYFNARGRAELARYILAYAKKEYIDHRISEDDWPAFKPLCPLGQMPVLELTDKDGKTTMMCQSSAIVRHLAEIFDLNGKTPEQKARADEAFECFHELFEVGMQLHTMQDSVKRKDMIARMRADLAPRIMEFLEAQAKANGGKNLTGGEEYTYADIALAMMTAGDGSLLYSGKGTGSEEEKEKFKQMFPTIIEIGKTVSQLPQIQEYLAKRPQTDY